MNTIVADKIPQLAGLCRKHSVVKMYIFGSAATGTFNEKSDIDLLVSFSNEVKLEEYADNFFDLMHALEDLFGRRVDLVIEKTLTNPYFIKSVEQTKQLIYAAA